MADVVNLHEARDRIANGGGSSGPPNPILDALDALGVALADHEHTWTDREHHLYEVAVAYAKGMTNGGSL